LIPILSEIKKKLASENLVKQQSDWLQENYISLKKERKYN
jgi:hypothetical protein